ncbi:unnamed protein product [Blepharisma stoltei]|uniref:Uncharacterized protein n=1 Tax=Blepharisma stoltei TaxID=1481888 RepID=A0AAU9JU58_9CILI|nr:unnamed protein product [Blepharisma stoltei]
MLILLLVNFAVGRWLENPLKATALTCGVYQCAPTSIVITDGNCGKIFENKFYYLQVCPSSSTLSYCNTTSLTCVATPAAAALQSYPGEPCVSQSDCIYGTCTASVCAGAKLNEKCTIHEQCNPGLRCYGGSCVVQLAIGSAGCRDEQDCVNYSGCNMTYSSQNGTCIQYASLSDNLVVTDCANGLSEMCASGYCSHFGSWYSTLGICKSAPMTVGTVPVACTADTDCLGTDGTNLVLSKCQCGYNNLGQSYCAPFIGDSSGINLISSWITALKNSTGCNTSRRSTNQCLKLTGHYSQIQSAIYGFNYYPQIINNDACVKAIYTATYWNYDSSVILKALFSLMLLNAL